MIDKGGVMKIETNLDSYQKFMMVFFISIALTFWQLTCLIFSDREYNVTIEEVKED